MLWKTNILYKIIHTSYKTLKASVIIDNNEKYRLSTVGPGPNTTIFSCHHSYVDCDILPHLVSFH